MVTERCCCQWQVHSHFDNEQSYGATSNRRVKQGSDAELSQSVVTSKQELGRPHTSRVLLRLILWVPAQQTHMCFYWGSADPAVQHSPARPSVCPMSLHRSPQHAAYGLQPMQTHTHTPPCGDAWNGITITGAPHASVPLLSWPCDCMLAAS